MRIHHRGFFPVISISSVSLKHLAPHFIVRLNNLKPCNPIGRIKFLLLI